MMLGPIGALPDILELIEYVEPLIFLAGKELTQHRAKQSLLCTPLAIYMLNIFVIDRTFHRQNILYLDCPRP